MSSFPFHFRNHFFSLIGRYRSTPVIGDVDGQYLIDQQRKTIDWQISVIDSSNANGVLGFTVSAEDVSAFFPVKINFTSQSCFCPVQVLGAQHALTGQPVDILSETLLSTEEFLIV
jgi:hypothetical protein